MNIRLAATLACVALAPAVGAAAPVLRRDPSDYFALGLRSTGVKNLAIQAPGCNVGVDCPRPSTGGTCGTLRGRGLTIAAPGQAAGDALCADGSLFEVFRNNPGVCAPDCSTIASPGIAADCTQPFAPSILGDPDGDGHPSCDAGCTIDPDDVARACGVALPLPACDPQQEIIVKPDEDCPFGDTVPGNFRCDLAPGTYGDVVVRTGGRIDFGAGTTVVCGLRAGRSTRITSNGAALVIVPGRGKVRLGNLTDAGSECGLLRFVTERGGVQFGKDGEFTVDACSISGFVRIGHDNVLKGHFIGVKILSDLDNDGFCCDGSTTTTTTTTTSTTTTTRQTTTTTQNGTTTTTRQTTTTTKTTTTRPATTTTHYATTTTTRPSGGCTRTLGFWKTHPSTSSSVLNGVGGVTVCGRHLTNVNVNDARSILEALCIAPQGSQRVQLVRQLTAAALNVAAGGPAFAEQARCDAVCQDSNATTAALSGCITAADAYNQSGDGLVAPFDPTGAASPTACDQASRTPCSFTRPYFCAYQ